MNHWCRTAGLIVLALTQSPLTADQPSDLQLTLPNQLYGVVGSDVGIYFDNIVLTQTPEEYQFDVTCDVGQTDGRRWHVTPTAEDTGSRDLIVTVHDGSGQKLAEAATRLHIAAADSESDDHIRLLLVGDSLTHATQYPNALADLLNGPNNPRWSMLGTHRPANAAAGVAHEGYGGWTWQRFVSHYEPNPDGTHRKRSSPFVFLNPDGKSQLNIKHYLSTSAEAASPDIVFFMLGINDCFGADPTDVAAMDTRIDAMLTQADILVAAFREAAPDCDLAICVTTPPNAREAAFEANYKGRYTRWGWKRIQHRLVQRLLQHFDPQTSENPERLDRVFIVPTQLNLDPIDGYPANNGVHPNSDGYQQIAVSIYAWLTWHLQHSEQQ